MAARILLTKPPGHRRHVTTANYSLRAAERRYAVSRYRTTGVAPHAGKPNILDRLAATACAWQYVVDRGKQPVVAQSGSEINDSLVAAIRALPIASSAGQNVQTPAT